MQGVQLLGSDAGHLAGGDILVPDNPRALLCVSGVPILVSGLQAAECVVHLYPGGHHPHAGQVQLLQRLAVCSGSYENVDLPEQGRPQLSLAHIRAHAELLQSLRVHEHDILVCRAAGLRQHLCSWCGHLHSQAEVHFSLQHGEQR